MSRLLQVLSGGKGKGTRASIAQKDAEIARLKEKMWELYARNDELGRENRELRIRSGELNAAYNGLKEILQNRGVCVS